VRERYPPPERPRRVREISYRRLLFRLFTVQPERWVVKGGAALLLRLDPNRTSNDIDLTYVLEVGEHASAVEALRDAARYDAGDHFEFEIAPGHLVDAGHPLERAYSVPVIARVGEKEFARFSVDLALPREDVDVEWIEAQTSLTGHADVDALPKVATLTFSAQLADKLCALYERHGEQRQHSSRARDLADIAMIAAQVDLNGRELAARVRSEERRRFQAGTLTQGRPESLLLADEQTQDWARRWERATRGAPITFDDALAQASALIDPVLAGSVDDATWDSSRSAWRD
jgi:hypothetical protein